MQVPEKLTLIGGSILLASTLVFTLKSQASSVLPHVGSSISHVFDHIGDAQKSSDFDENLKQAQKNGETNGMWGTAPWYIDSGMNMHVGSGQLNRPLYKVLNDQDLHTIKTINFEQAVQAPQDSYGLLAGKNMDKGADGDGNSSITAINGLENMDTSQVTQMGQMFYCDFNLSNDLNIDNWDVSHVTGMDGIFGRTGLTSVNVPDWNVSQVQDLGHAFLDAPAIQHIDMHNWYTDHGYLYMDHIFAGDSSLKSLDVSHLDTSNSDMEMAFGGDDVSPPDGELSHLTLGNQFYFKNNSGLSGEWKSGSQAIRGDQFPYSNTNSSGHPGTWIKQ